MSPTASTSAQPARPALAPQRPSLKRSSPGTAIICDKTINQQIAFERELQNLMEAEYRDDVQEYMYDMEVCLLLKLFCFGIDDVVDSHEQSLPLN